MSWQSRNAGFTLVEILVALVIFLVSALGIAGLVTRTVQQETESYQRVQAVLLLQDMQERLSANRQVASCYAGSITLGSGFTGASTLSCNAGTAAQQAIAVADLKQWDNSLKDSAEKTNTSNAGALIGARGCIRVIDAAQQLYQITVAWQGMGETVVPSDKCGEFQYGDETRRRTVSAQVRFATLSS